MIPPTYEVMGKGKRAYYLARHEMERRRGNYAIARWYELLAELLPLEEE